jgi:hypothetical protein
VIVHTEIETAEAVALASWRLRAYSIAALVGLAVAIFALAMAANESEAPAATAGGDFPAFYGAAVIAADGDWEHLYDFDRQVAAQRDLQEDEGSARYFAYPPQVALAHAPLAALEYGWAYLVYTVIMFILLVATVVLAAPLLPWLEGRTWPAVVIAISFWPMARAVTGGSNMAVPLIGLMLVIGLLRVVAGAAVGAVAFYLSAVPLAGWAWPLEWWDVAKAFGKIDSEVNGFSSVSWLGFLENAWGVGDPLAAGLGWALAVLTALGLVWLWRRNGREGLGALLAITMPGILLLSPHALSHDTAIVLLTIAVLHSAGGLPRWLIVVVWLLGVSQAWIASIGFSPGIFILILLSWWSITRLDLLGPSITARPGHIFTRARSR